MSARQQNWKKNVNKRNVFKSSHGFPFSDDVKISMSIGDCSETERKELVERSEWDHGKTRVFKKKRERERPQQTD